MFSALRIDVAPLLNTADVQNCHFLFNTPVNPGSPPVSIPAFSKTAFNDISALFPGEQLLTSFCSFTSGSRLAGLKVTELTIIVKKVNDGTGIKLSRTVKNGQKHRAGGRVSLLYTGRVVPGSICPAVYALPIHSWVHPVMYMRQTAGYTVHLVSAVVQ